MRPSGKTVSLPPPPKPRVGLTLAAGIVKIKPKQADEKAAQY